MLGKRQDLNPFSAALKRLVADTEAGKVKLCG
jgi:hypothetical protein